MVVCSTSSQYPKKHLITWYSSHGHTIYQLKHILVKFYRALTVDIFRTYRDAEMGNANSCPHVILCTCFEVHLLTRRPQVIWIG